MSTRQKLENKEYLPEKWEDVACPMCGSVDRKFLEHFGNRNQYTHALCNSCHLVYLNPRPAYNDTFVNDAYEFYAENDERYQLSDKLLYEKTAPHIETELSEILKCDKQRTALLDVGCAIGHFLYVAKKHYPIVYGLEVSKRMAAVVKERLGITVFTDKFEKLKIENRFSCIYMSHILEHYPYPNEWLQKVRQLLMPTGILVVNVPNMFSLDRKYKRTIKRLGLYRGNWESWRTPDHLFEPTVPAMLKLFEKNNFKVLGYYSYSKKDIISQSFFSRIYRRKWLFGSNLRFYATPI